MNPDVHYWHGKQVCVTGGTGFLGFHLVRQLLELGARVRILSLPARPDHPIHSLSSVEQFNGDICDPKIARQALAGCAVVFHTAASVAVWGKALARMRAVHVDGTRTVIEAADAGARIVHTSSLVAVGGTTTGEPLTETSPFTLDGVRIDYVHAKRDAELVALAAAAQGRDVVVTNPGYLVGPEDYEGSVMGRFCSRFWKGRVLLAPTTGGWSLVDVRDVARGHLLAAEHGQRGRRYLLAGENHTIRGFMIQLARAGGFRPRFIPVLPSWAQFAFALGASARSLCTGREPYPSLQVVRLNRYCWFADSSRARTELGYEFRPLADTLAETFAWYRDRGDLTLRGLNRWWLRPSAAKDDKPAQSDHMV